MQIFGAIISISWVVFIVVWLVGMLTAKRTVRRPWYQMWLVRIVVLVAVIAAVHYSVITPQEVSPLRAFSQATNSPLLGAVGALLTVLGVTLAIWARLYLGRNWGMPQSLKDNPELVTTGPYAYVRNPIYSGVLLAMIGSACISPWWIFIVVVAGIYFVWSAIVEDRIMLREFPDTYPTYKARTKMLLPFIF